MINIDDLIGVKFKDHGRSVKEGFDCYGLAIEVSKRYGHDFPDLWYQKADNETFAKNYINVLSELGGKLKETSVQEESNIVIFFENGKGVHVGVIVDDDMFIHADIYGVRIVRLSTYYRKDWRVYQWQQ